MTSSGTHVNKHILIHMSSISGEYNALLDFLACPVTKQALHYDVQRNCLISYAAKLVFPIVDGIPVLLIESATALED